MVVEIRVISGLRKGHKLKSPRGTSTRPTEDRIKESLFNILGGIKSDSIVLDLFAGSGSIGIEFLSRGAAKCYFIDNLQSSIDIIKDNLQHTKLKENSIVIKEDASKLVGQLFSKGLKFDYIYLDPPFKEHGLLYEIISLIGKYNLLSASGILIVEHEKDLLLEEDIDYFKRSDYRKYGNKSLSFYKVQD